MALETNTCVRARRGGTERRIHSWLAGVAALIGIDCAVPMEDAESTEPVGVASAALLGPLPSETNPLIPPNNPGSPMAMRGPGGVTCEFENPSRQPEVLGFGNNSFVSFGQTVVCNGPVDFIDISVRLFFVSVEQPPAPNRLIGGASERMEPIVVRPAPNYLSRNSLDTGAVTCPSSSGGVIGLQGLTDVNVRFLGGEPEFDGVANFPSPLAIVNCGAATGVPAPPIPEPPAPDPESARTVATRCQMATLDDCVRFAAEAGVQLVITRVDNADIPANTVFSTRVRSAIPPVVDVVVSNGSAAPALPPRAAFTGTAANCPTPDGFDCPQLGDLPLTWTLVPGATRYQLEQSLQTFENGGPVRLPFVLIAETTSPAFTVPASQRSFFVEMYRVRACHGECGPYSNVANFFTPFFFPGPGPGGV